ncbi:MAG TPA: hypothetical protein VN843_24935, partial [Anaerolineales bacterium]|nr:hypothetical protein [Anaerolineales bacterium]
MYLKDLVKIELFTSLLVDLIFLSSCQPTNIEITLSAVASSAPTDPKPTLTSDISTTTDGPSLAICPMFPANNVWNARVDSLVTHPMSDVWIDSIGRDESFHMDFGSGTWDGGSIGIPFNIVSGSTVTKYTPDFYYPDESDAGPYPIPDDPLMEYSSYHHILVLDTDTCTLYEIYDASFGSSQWSGGSGAVWDLNSNTLRPETWTS